MRAVRVKKHESANELTESLPECRMLPSSFI